MLAIASAKNVPASSNDSPNVQRALSGVPVQSRDRLQVCPWLVESLRWLSDEMTMVRNDGFDARTIRVFLGVVEQHKQLLEDAWHDYFA